MSTGGTPLHHRDVETEELIQEQRHHIEELEKNNQILRDKYNVSRQQLLSLGVQGTSHNGKKSSSIGKSDSIYTSIGMQYDSGLLNDEATRLLEEAKQDNRALEEKINNMNNHIMLMQQEIDQKRGSIKKTELFYTEEIRKLKDQLFESQRSAATENVEKIGLHKTNATKLAEIENLQSKVKYLYYFLIFFCFHGIFSLINYYFIT